MLRPVRVAAPSEMPISLVEAKAHLRVIELDENGQALPNEDDDLISALIGAAVDHLDGYSGVLGRCMVTQQWKARYRTFAGCLRLPLPDVSGVEITYFDSGNAEQTLDASTYDVLEDAIGPVVLINRLFSAPDLYERADAVSITLTAGYGDAVAVPQALKLAILLLVGHWYENRDAVTVGTVAHDMPMAVNTLISPYRRVSV